MQEPWPPDIQCRVCKAFRPFETINVKTVDTSEQWGLPEGTMRQNLQFCKDKPACRKAAKAWEGYA